MTEPEVRLNTRNYKQTSEDRVRLLLQKVKKKVKPVDGNLTSVAYSLQYLSKSSMP